VHPRGSFDRDDGMILLLIGATYVYQTIHRSSDTFFTRMKAHHIHPAVQPSHSSARFIRHPPIYQSIHPAQPSLSSAQEQVTQMCSMTFSPKKRKQKKTKTTPQNLDEASIRLSSITSRLRHHHITTYPSSCHLHRNSYMQQSRQ
jgi:hypothetical protein